jgi:hypothetical protein
MAHFTDVNWIRISGQNLDRQMRERKESGLWDFRDFDGQPLNMESQFLTKNKKVKSLSSRWT